MEVKISEVSVDMLSQLLEYTKLFSERLSLDPSSVEGIYVGKVFHPEAIKYVKERAKNRDRKRNKAHNIRNRWEQN